MTQLHERSGAADARILLVEDEISDAMVVKRSLAATRDSGTKSSM